MKRSSIFSEAWRDITSGTSRTISCLAILAVLAIVVTMFDLNTVAGLQHQARQWVSSGSSIHILAQEQEINPVSCGALTEASGKGANGKRTHPIQSAGALREDDDVTLDAMPSVQLDQWDVTPSMADVLGVRFSNSDSASSGVWISDQLANTLKVRQGDSLPSNQGVMHIAGIFPWPEDGRDQRIAYSVITSTSTSWDEPWDECWASVNPSNPSAKDLINTAWFAYPGGIPSSQIRQANVSLGTSADLNAQYNARSSRFMLALTPLLAFVIALFAVRMRKVEIADDLHMGLPRRGLHVIFALETLGWSVPAVLLCVAASMFAATAMSGRANAVTFTLVQLPPLIAALLTAQLGTAVGLTSIRSTQLFAFFKNRR
ncbi:hypothetical protein OZX67_00855 [Bifidobacterium sp. ESL0728]|uniref:hypothetical protein n=1 Tax=Bifidobacterium sp. ESL0728 TaxID=2983220 RepID=UPI0023F71ADF|nr:hypothetical protein [Bifidobacterium sp. ESL0728]WEV59156.1 hypothetical protein OZX67_00855 [Bifidobacterium sp. ESL0728]